MQLYYNVIIRVGKNTESVHPRNFQYGLVIWHTKKGRKNFWGLACGKRGIALFGVKSIECCKKRLNDVIVFCASFNVYHNLLCNPLRLPATTLTQTYIHNSYTTQHSKRRTTATHLRGLEPRSVIRRVQRVTDLAKELHTNVLLIVVFIVVSVEGSHSIARSQVWLGLPANRFQSGGTCRIHAARARWWSSRGELRILELHVRNDDDDDDI